MPPTVVIVGTLDTKGEEVGYLRELIQQAGCSTLIVDVGVLLSPTIAADFTRDQVASAGGATLKELLQRKDRRVAIETMTRGAASLVQDLHRQDRMSAIVSVGGGTGTHIGTGVMRALPLGVGKLMVSTVASRDMSQLIGTKDIAVLHSVVDLLGLNPISRRILDHAASAIVGMARNAGPILSAKPMIGLTSFGFITEGAMHVKAKLEAFGYEVAPFHANGTGGMALEDLVEQGVLRGVVDFALHEFADNLYNGYCGAIGTGRLESAGRRGIPQVVVPGGLDCIVLEFNSFESMPPNMRGRKVFWYDFRSGVRTSRDDVRLLARTIGEKLNRAIGPVTFVIPMKGWSEADVKEGPLYEPETNQLFISELKSLLDSRVQVIEVDVHINAESFAQVVVEQLDTVMKKAVAI